jgi:hypothetical protein
MALSTGEKGSWVTALLDIWARFVLAYISSYLEQGIDWSHQRRNFRMSIVSQPCTLELLQFAPFAPVMVRWVVFFQPIQNLKNAKIDL